MSAATVGHPAPPAPPGAVRRAVNAADLVARVLAGSLLVAVVVLVALQVVFRYVVGASLAWTEEVSRICFVALSVLGIALAHRRALHAGYTSVVERVPGGVRRVLLVVVDVVALVFYGTVGASGAALAAVTGGSLTPATGLPFAVVQSVFVVTAVLGVVFTLESLAAHVRGQEVARPTTGVPTDGDDAAGPPPGTGAVPGADATPAPPGPPPAGPAPPGGRGSRDGRDAP